MKNLGYLTVTMGVIWGGAPVFSHHSPFAKFNFQDIVTIQGVVTRYELKNPHAMVYLDVIDDQGDIENWAVEMAGLLSLTRRGWTDQTLSLGDTVTVTGNRILTGGNELWWNQMTLEDGTVFVEPTTEDSNTIDEQRRQQAQDSSQN